jgi:polyhydroxybutyrate depolymerase
MSQRATRPRTTATFGRPVACALALLPFLLVPAGTSAAPEARQATIMHWTIDGVQRDAIVFAPAPTTVAVKHPLVLGFHGHGGKMQATALQFHIQALWPQAVVVYPQGLNSQTPNDPSGTKPGWQFKAGDSGDRDLKLVDAIVTTMNAKYSVDKRRIYTTGFSNGGVFSYLLWSARPKTIAAVGEVAGRLEPTQPLTVPRALLAVAGRTDTVNPFPGQQQSIATARQANGATGAGVPCGLFCTFYASAGGTPVKTLIHPGGHVVPPWAPAAIVKFFKAHKQP